MIAFAIKVVCCYVTACLLCQGVGLIEAAAIASEREGRRWANR